MRKKGFTLVELLVVIAIIALLMGILMPALNRVRQNAYQLVCGTNMKGIGNAVLMYSNTFNEQFPRAGGPTTVWGAKVKFDAANANLAYGITGTATGSATITSSLYLLVKYGDVTPKVFLCKADSDAVEFESSTGVDLTALYDFGNTPTRSCSFSYHNPYGNYRLTSNGESGMAVVADKNPFITTSEQPTPKNLTNFIPGGTKDQQNAGNSYAHQDEGQNVLYADNSVTFKKTSACGVNEDNIYTKWSKTNPIGDDLKKGAAPVAYMPASVPLGRADSLLVVDGTASSVEPKVRNCFLGETPVWTNNGFVQISNVTVGQVVGQDATVAEQLEIHEGTYTCRDITLSTGECVSVVSNHLFLTKSGLWVNANNLKSGMELQTKNGIVRIENITTRSFTGKVYNVKVRDSERYMVGNDMVIVRDW